MNSQRARLGDILVQADVITDAQLQTALAHQRETVGRKPRLGSVIVALELASESDIARALARQLDIPFVDLDAVVAEPDVMQLVPRWLARRHTLVPVRRQDGALIVAMADPTNLVAIDDARTSAGIQISPVVATATAIADAEERFYASDLGAAAILDRLGEAAEVEVVPEEGTDLDPSLTPEALEKAAAMAPIIRLVNALLADGARARGTDIHIEPQPTELKVRYRVDGLLREVMSLPKHVQALVVSRIKIMSGMDIAERRRPQDGRGRILVDGRQIDTRVSSIPTFAGEKIVIRLLPAGAEYKSLSQMGFEEDQLNMLRQHLAMPQGLIVFTGPTGAGKTSTMYSALSHVKTPEKNIVTLEDPIEYQIPELNQTQIDEKSGITFARGLRTLLRQDPDVIMVGEIRDLETAQIVMQSSLTGHLVLSSLHTNDAASAVTRLVDLGVEPYLIASALMIVVAQRLVRIICPDCIEPATPSDRTITSLDLSMKDVEGVRFMQGAGCQLCGYTGYRGRTGIFEVLPLTSALREQITAQVSDVSLNYAIRAAGVRSLRRSGLMKVRQGITTLEEVLRVTQMERQHVSRCPSCRHEIDSGFVVCPYCNHELETRACPVCEKEVRPEWRVCPYCRTELPGTQTVVDERQRLRILVIDDDPSLRKLAEAMFGADFEVLVAEDGEGGLKRATLERPDLILLDLHLPDISGQDVARRLRKTASTSLIPVIMITGKDDGASEIESLRAGVDHYVVKPFDEEALRARMEAVLRRSIRHRAPLLG
ncbi:MAG: response regulator [Actinobacteria bacterium]|nr:response regulator [Actinomycetota bacterium]